MAIQTRTINYRDAASQFEGMMAWDDSFSEPRPGVLVAHTIRGRTPFEEQKARDLAALGFVGFAADVYGAATIGSDDDKARALMTEMLGDRVELQGRLSLSLATMAEQVEVAEDKCAAIGFCFGGLSVLDLARIGAPLSGVVSFHGLLESPGNTESNAIGASVLTLHGWDDPMAKPDAVVAFGDEMTAAGADWQIHGYGGTSHSFTNPAANDIANGLAYNENADRRSRIAMENFLAELFE
jgi:dienelactone hydrolase